MGCISVNVVLKLDVMIAFVFCMVIYVRNSIVSFDYIVCLVTVLSCADSCIFNSGEVHQHILTILPVRIYGLAITYKA